MLITQQANIIRAMLIIEGKAFEAGKNIDWSIFVSSEPDEPDNCLTIYNNRGTLQGRIHETGETVQHYGFQTKIRGKTDAVASAKGRQLMGVYDGILRYLITVDGQALRIQSITIRSPLLPMGQESKNRRQLYVFNAIATIDEV